MSQEAVDSAKKIIRDLRKRLSKLEDEDIIIEKLVREVRRLDGGQGSDKDYEATARRLLKITRR